MDNLKSILDKVQKPGRYIGSETNSVRKSFMPSRVSIAIAYPDMYEVGMSYLGLRILYHLLNERDDIVCERVFTPWSDMEEELISSGQKLFSLESKTEINKFDIVGFSLSYELTFTNVLNMLHLSGISVRSEDRGDEEPLVIAGGACCYNPEPMSAFIDAFLIGDGEEALPEFIDKYKELKMSTKDRKKILRGLAGLDGVYVPSLYRVEYVSGRFSGIEAIEKGIPLEIKKNTVKDLDNAYYPVKQITPLVKIVHDRTAVEVMRGCPNRCRFCQAGTTSKPVRIRSVERVREICHETYTHTGNERIAILSLSTVNYPYLGELISGINEDFKDKGVGISIPSLRIDEAFYDLPAMISAIRKAGLTFAPESALDTVRESIGKDIDLAVLCKSVSLAYSHGWRRLKLYFMVGFPFQDDEAEVEQIVKLSRELSFLKKKVSQGAAEVKVSVNPFVPKTHTPFQWLSISPMEKLLKVKGRLLSSRSRKIDIDVHDIKQSILEACIARGDRRMGDVIYSAWFGGAKMDGWTDSFDFAVWERAFSENGLDVHEYAGMKYSLEAPLPWAHIKTDVSDNYLKEEFQNSGFAD